MRSSVRSLAGQPLLVGAVTVLVVAVAVVLAYEANRGLPFTAADELRVELPDAASLTAGAEVRIGGSRAGAVDRLEPVVRDDGTVIARAHLRLDPDRGPLRAGTTATVRPRSLLGLKYLELTPGAPGRPALQPGATLPLRQARPEPVDLDQVLAVFDEDTRRNATAGLREVGTALAGRGPDLNTAIAGARALLDPLRRVAGRLSARETGLPRLVPALARVAAEVAPAGEAQAGLVRGAARTFAALDRAGRALDDALAQAPRTLDVAVRELPVQRPLLAQLAGLARDLGPGARALRASAGDLAGAVEAGAPGLRSSRALSARLEPTFRRLDAFNADPRTPIGLRALTGSGEALAPLVAQLTPAQTTCNLVGLLLRNAVSLLSEGGTTGTWQRFIIIAAPEGPDNEGGPSARPAQGPNPDNFLHSNPYPHTAGPGEPRECEAGNEPFTAGRLAIGNAPGRQGGTEAVADPQREAAP